MNPFKYIWGKIKALWEKIKDWSGWSTAGSIFIARLEMAAGFVTAVFQGLDWDSLLNLDFSNGINKPVVIGGGLLLAKGIISEWTRRHGAKDL